MNFIIYDNINKKGQYENIIYNFVGIREEEFKIFNFSDYKPSSYTNNIYIISTSSIKEGLKLANSIRQNNDWKSQIIIIINKLLILDYIDINNFVCDQLKEDFYIAYKILTKNKNLSFIYNSEIIKIPYNDILYIEKLNNQNYCTIYTKKTKYVIKNTITMLEKSLDSACFMKTHRSCIVNLQNIKNYCCPKNIIYFNNGISIDLISRDKRQILKSKLIEENIQI